MSFTLSVVATKRNEEKRREEKTTEIFFLSKIRWKKHQIQRKKFCPPCKIETLDTTHHTTLHYYEYYEEKSGPCEFAFKEEEQRNGE